MEKTFFTIGNIAKIRWHTMLHKITSQDYGHIAYSYDNNNMIQSNIEFEYNCDYNHSTINENMTPDKHYAMIAVNENGEIYIRNLFDNSDPKGFHQKNTYFEDFIDDRLTLSDNNSLLLSYIKINNPNATKNDFGKILYFCVEYEMNANHFNNLIKYVLAIKDHIFIKDENPEIKQENKKYNVFPFLTKFHFF